MNLPTRLKEYRDHHRLLQKEMGDKLGITREHYAQIERGHKTPSVRLLMKTAHALQITTVIGNDATPQFVDDQESSRQMLPEPSQST